MSIQFLDFDVPSSGGQVERAAAGNFVRYSIITTGVSGPRIRVRTDKGDDLVMKPGDKVRTSKPFTTLKIAAYDGIQVIGFLQVGEGTFDSDSVVGNVTVDGTVAVSSVAGTVTVQESGHSYGAAFASTALLTANTPEAVISAAANIAGYVVWAATLKTARSTGNISASMLAKASAPSGIADGDVLLFPASLDITSSMFHGGGELQRAVRVASGKRLDFIASATEDNFPASRRALYTLL